MLKVGGARLEVSPTYRQIRYTERLHFNRLKVRSDILTPREMISRYVDVLLLSLLLLTLHAAAEPLRDSTPEQTVLGPGNITSSASDGTPGLEPGTSWDLTSRDDQKKLVRLNSAFAEASFVAWAAGIHEPTEQEAKLYFGAEDDDRPYRARSHIRFTFERAAGLKQGYMAEEYKHVKWEKHDPANVCAEKKVLAYVVQKDRKDDASGIINICPEFWSLGLPLAAELDCKKLTKTPTMFVNKDKPGEVPWLTVSGVILHELLCVSSFLYMAISP